MDERAGLKSMASFRADDIGKVVAARDPSLDAEGPADAGDWDLVVVGSTRVEPQECSAELDPDANNYDVVVTGETPSDASWAVLVTTNEDLTDVDSVTLNGSRLDLRR